MSVSLFNSMAKPAGEKVPQQMQCKFDEITKLTDAFCTEYLNTEFRSRFYPIFASR